MNRKILSLFFFLSIFNSLNSKPKSLYSSSLKPTRTTAVMTIASSIASLLFVGYNLYSNWGAEPISKQGIIKNIKASSQLIGLSAAIGLTFGYVCDLYLHHKILHRLLKPRKLLMKSGAAFGLMVLFFRMIRHNVGKKLGFPLALVLYACSGMAIGYILGLSKNSLDFVQHENVQKCFELFTQLSNDPILNYLYLKTEKHSDWPLQQWDEFWDSAKGLKIVEQIEQKYSLQNYIEALDAFSKLLGRLKRKTTRLYLFDELQTLEDKEKIHKIEHWISWVEFQFSKLSAKTNSLILSEAC